MESRKTASGGGGVAGGGIEQKGKRTHGQGQQCNSVVIAGWRRYKGTKW